MEDAQPWIEPTSPRLLPPGGAWPGATRIHLGTLRQRIHGLLFIGLAGLLLVGWLDELGLAWLAGQVPALQAALSGNSTLERAIWEALCMLPWAWLVLRAIRTAVDSVRYLEGQVPHCSCCGKVESGGHWMGLAEFVRRNSELRLTSMHCESCARQQPRQD